MKKFLSTTLVLFLALFLASPIRAQQGPVKTAQVNSTFYVGAVNGFYPTIQSAVTAACANTHAKVVISAGVTPGDTIGAVTSGCSGVPIVDERNGIPAANYNWTGVAYAAVSSTSFPCDILAAAGTPCIAAHSVTRKMLSSYTGALFELQRISDSATLEVGALPSGMVNIAPIATFCLGTTCNFSILYDQMGTPSVGNNLPQASSSHQAPVSWATFSDGVVPIVSTASGQYYRNRTSTVNMPTGSAAITAYMVVSNASSSTCCGTYGDMESTVADTGNGHMFALAYATGVDEGTEGTGSGPWPGVDLENGVWKYGATPAFSYLNILTKYATAGPTSEIKSGDATTGSLSTLYNSTMPGSDSAHWEGGLSLGEGGDGSGAPTAFLEGVITASTTTDATDNALQANIASFYSAPLVASTPNVNGLADPLVINGGGVSCAAVNGTQTCNVPLGTITIGSGIGPPVPFAIHRYWRITATTMEDGGSNWEISELQFRAVAGTIQAPSGGTWLSTQGSPGTTLGDLNFGSYFQTNKNQSIGYDFGSPVTVAEVAIAPYCTYVLDSPSAFTVQYSDDGTTWHTISLVTGAAYSCSTYQLAELPGSAVVYTFYYDTSTTPYTFWGYLGGTYYQLSPAL